MLMQKEIKKKPAFSHLSRVAQRLPGRTDLWLDPLLTEMWLQQFSYVILWRQSKHGNSKENLTEIAKSKQ